MERIKQNVKKPKGDALKNGLVSTKNIALATKINDKQFILDFVKGEMRSNEAWFIKVEGEAEFVVLPENILNRLLGTIKTNHEEKVFLTLKNELKDLLPLDLDDVMVVAINELESYRGKDGSLPIINVKHVAKSIKRKYPNLFVSLPTLFL